MDIAVVKEEAYEAVCKFQLVIILNLMFVVSKSYIIIAWNFDEIADEN